MKAVVLRHQERRDGKYPVSIRVIQNRQVSYIPTGLYVSKSQIHKKTFEIKDQLVLMRTGQTIADYEKRLLSIETEQLRQMSGKDLVKVLTVNKKGIDYLGYCKQLVEEDSYKWSSLKSALLVIEEMGITRMMATDFTSQFIYRFKDYMDNKKIAVMRGGKQVGIRGYSVRTKNSYLIEVCKVFRMLQRQYNTEFDKVIAHDPFVGFSYYKEEVTQKRAMTVEDVRSFFRLQPKNEKTRQAQDLMLLSFGMCGINLCDLLILRREQWDRKENRIVYERHKTRGVRADNALSSIRIEPEVEEVFRRYLAKDGELLFDFGESRDVRCATRNIAMSVDRLCKETGFKHVSPYSFRHTWATIARNECDISKDDIDLCLNHVGQNKMADVYIKPDWSRIDRANRKVLDYVFVD